MELTLEEVLAEIKKQRDQLADEVAMLRAALKKLTEEKKPDGE